MDKELKEIQRRYRMTKFAKDNYMLKEHYGGFKADFKLKKELRHGYYSVSCDPLYFEIKVPVDLQDLKKALSAGFLTYYTGCLGSKPPGFKEVYSTAKLKEWPWVWSELIKGYPKACTSCGYERYQRLTLTRISMGTCATFECPYCKNVVDLKWEEKW